MFDVTIDVGIFGLLTLHATERYTKSSSMSLVPEVPMWALMASISETGISSETPPTRGFV